MKLYTKEHGWRTPAELAALSAGNRAASFVNDPSSLLDIPESEKCWCHVCKKEVISCVCPQRLSTWFTRICIQVAHLNSDKCIFCGTSFPAEVLRCLCNWLLQTVIATGAPKECRGAITESRFSAETSDQFNGGRCGTARGD
jgi:hypothetical protein